jgi:hypothetical protein
MLWYLPLMGREGGRTNSMLLIVVGVAFVRPVAEVADRFEGECDH